MTRAKSDPEEACLRALFSGQRMRKAAGTRPVSTWLADLIEDHLDERALEEQWLAFYEGVSPKAADV